MRKTATQDHFQPATPTQNDLTKNKKGVNEQ